jgi:hypothetical protein
MSSEWIDPELSAEEDAEVKRQRREQSDRQSRKLGEKLLQGWCMLEETCPAGCLVRPPSIIAQILIASCSWI